jgi:hypothetical protein
MAVAGAGAFTVVAIDDDSLPGVTTTEFVSVALLPPGLRLGAVAEIVSVVVPYAGRLPWEQVSTLPLSVQVKPFDAFTPLYETFDGNVSVTTMPLIGAGWTWVEQVIFGGTESRTSQTRVDTCGLLSVMT